MNKIYMFEKGITISCDYDSLGFKRSKPKRMKNIILATCLLFSTSLFSQSGCTELFFSEYGEGSSTNKYIEIYNPTANAVSLSTYTVYLCTNGSTSNPKIFDSVAVSIAPGDVYVITNILADSTILAEADTALAYLSIAVFNGDDALILVNGTDTIDVIGVPGVDPGSSGVSLGCI
jgi:predicted extracellular nuclease